MMTSSGQFKICGNGLGNLAFSDLTLHEGFRVLTSFSDKLKIRWCQIFARFFSGGIQA